MHTFLFRGSVADVDETIEGDPLHPSTVVLVDAVDSITRVIVPDDLLENRRELLTVGQRIEVSGQIQDGPAYRACVARRFQPPRDQMH